MTSIDIAAMSATEKLQLMESLRDAFCLEAKNDVTSPAGHGAISRNQINPAPTMIAP